MGAEKRTERLGPVESGSGNRERKFRPANVVLTSVLYLNDRIKKFSIVHIKCILIYINVNYTYIYIYINSNIFNIINEIY